MNVDPMQNETAVDSAAPAPSGQSDVGTAISNVLRQPAFIITAGALLVAAIFLNFAVSFLQIHFKKEPALIPPRSI